MVSSFAPAAHEALLPYLAEEDRDAVPIPLDVSFSSVVVRLGGHVARIARNPDAQRGHHREALTLQVVAGRLPIAVPAPLRLIPTTQQLPFGAALQPYLAGRAMQANDAARYPDIAEHMAQTLRALHILPVDAFPDGALLDLDPEVEADRLWLQTEDHLESRLPPPSFRRVRERLSELRAQTAAPRVICHGDPWFGNFLLAEDGSLVALLDFEDACTADPAFDLAATTYLSERFVSTVLEVYRSGASESLPGDARELNGRIRAYRMIRELGGLAYCLRNGQAEEAEHALRDVVEALG